MRIETVDSHSFCPDLISDGCHAIIDAGSSDFEFAKYFDRASYAHIFCIDPNRKILWKDSPINVTFIRAALETIDGTMIYNDWSTGEGNCTSTEENKLHYAEDSYEVETITLDTLLRHYGIAQVDLLKLDIEGSEYDVLKSITKPIAKQISVEFHDNISHKYPGGEYYAELMAGEFGKLYHPVKHECTNMGGIANYWDSLFVLKELL